MREFVIGGIAQGKLKYVLDKYNLTQEDVCNGEECDYNNINKRVVYNFHIICKRLLEDHIDIRSFVEELINKNEDIIIISNEIGYGIIPEVKKEKIWREETGRASTIIAKEFEIVTRVISGIPMVLKEESKESIKVKINTSTLKIALLRHGQTAGNKNKKYIGITDESLSLNGIYELFDFIGKEIYPSVNKVYCSPMKRCIESANMIYPNAEISIIDNLREINFGDFENKTYEELKDNLNYQRWLASKRTFPIPNGEENELFNERCTDAFEEIINKSIKEDCIALVVHTGTIKAILNKYSKQNKDFNDITIENGQGFLIEIDKNNWINSKKIKILHEIRYSK